MRKYYYTNAQGQQMPPVDLDGLRAAGINANTMIWYEGLPTWVRACEISELQSIVGTTPPAQPGYGQQQTYGQSSCGQPAYSQPAYGQPANPYQPQPQPQQQPPSSYLWLGILTTLFCCLPFGIVSIVYATKVNSYWGTGLYDQAMEASNKAKTWGLVSLGVGLVLNIIGFVIGVLGAI